MAEDQWTTFLDCVSNLCEEVERRLHESDSNSLQEFLLRLQVNRTACERIIRAALEGSVEDHVALNVNENVKRLSNAIGGLIDDVETQLFRIDSSTYSSIILPEVLVNRTGMVGRPRIVVNLTQIEYLRTWRFTWSRICYTLCTSRTTLWRRLKEVNYDFQQTRFTDISSAELERQIGDVKANFVNCGERMVLGILRSRGIYVARHRVRDIIRRIDPINTALRWRAMHPRYQYNVPGPNALWHIDGLHKLIKWGFVVHGGIDGYSRLIVFLTCATNNRAATVFSSFLGGTRRYGIPSRIRTDYGGENTEVARYMESVRGRDRGSHIAGSSVYNQRIERLHRDTTRCCLSTFYCVFSYLEVEGLLDLSNDTDRFCLHYVFTPRINRALEEFRLGWNHHALSTECNQTPYQRWIAGVISVDFFGYTAVEDIRNPDISCYGIDLPSTSLVSDDDDDSTSVTVMEPICPLAKNQMHILAHEVDPLSNSVNFGVDIYLKTVNCVANILSTQT
ncbi:MAG: hypothetical protein DSY43_06230 [Gammaproteobacteria bacterium]|nr:MAG: hypothetical protein DSY43_06230 [Gammaproteobacteria bacterium]